MNKRIITIIITLIIALAAVCGGASAQPKVNGRAPIREKRGYATISVLPLTRQTYVYSMLSMPRTSRTRIPTLTSESWRLVSASRSTAASSSTFLTKKPSSGRKRKDIKVMLRKVFGLVAEKTFGRIGANWCILTISSVVTS